MILKRLTLKLHKFVFVCEEALNLDTLRFGNQSDSPYRARDRLKSFHWCFHSAPPKCRIMFMHLLRITATKCGSQENIFQNKYSFALDFLLIKE